MSARRFLAALLSFLAAGAGHAVLGRTRRGLVWLVVTAAASATIAITPWGMALVAAAIIGCASDAFAKGPREGATPGLGKSALLVAGFFLAAMPAKWLTGRYVYSVERMPEAHGVFVPGDLVVVRRGVTPSAGDVVFVAPAGDGAVGRFHDVVETGSSTDVTVKDGEKTMPLPRALVAGRATYVLLSFDAEGKLKLGRTGTR